MRRHVQILKNLDPDDHASREMSHTKTMKNYYTEIIYLTIYSNIKLQSITAIFTELLNGYF